MSKPDSKLRWFHSIKINPTFWLLTHTILTEPIYRGSQRTLIELKCLNTVIVCTDSVGDWILHNRCHPCRGVYHDQLLVNFSCRSHFNKPSFFEDNNYFHLLHWRRRKLQQWTLNRKETGSTGWGEMGIKHFHWIIITQFFDHQLDGTGTVEKLPGTSGWRSNRKSFPS